MLIFWKPTYLSNLFLTLFLFRYKLILEMPLNQLSSDHHAQKSIFLDTRQFTRYDLIHITDDSIKFGFRLPFARLF